MRKMHELATARVRHEPATEEALRRERDFAERLIETAPGIVLMLDTQGRVARSATSSSAGARKQNCRSCRSSRLSASDLPTSV